MTVCGTCRLGGGGAVWLVSPGGFVPGLPPLRFFCVPVRLSSCCRGFVLAVPRFAPAFSLPSCLAFCLRVFLVAEVGDRKYCPRLQFYFPGFEFQFFGGHSCGTFSRLC